MKHRITFGILISLIVLLSGCETFDVRLVAASSGPKTAPKTESSSSDGKGQLIRQFPRVGNNETVNLEPGTYHGGITISANSVTVRGAGRGRTVIDGNVTITGNNAVLNNLTIEGNVTVSGNNADLSGASVSGRITDNGKNTKR